MGGRLRDPCEPGPEPTEPPLPPGTVLRSRCTSGQTVYSSPSYAKSRTPRCQARSGLQPHFVSASGKLVELLYINGERPSPGTIPPPETTRHAAHRARSGSQVRL